MKFSNTLIPAKLIKRYKRFLADVELEEGSVVTAHCTNSGSMKTCIEEGAPVYLSVADNPKRKTKFTWEMIFLNNSWVGINTMIPNIIVFESIKEGLIDKLNGYNIIKREVKFDDSRFDLYLENKSEKCFVEVKNVTLFRNKDTAEFPDAPTARGIKHLLTLIDAIKKSYKTYLIFLVQIQNMKYFKIAKDIDEEYYKNYLIAKKAGVNFLAYRCDISSKKIFIDKKLKIIDD